MVLQKMKNRQQVFITSE